MQPWLKAPQGNETPKGDSGTPILGQNKGKTGKEGGDHHGRKGETKHHLPGLIPGMHQTHGCVHTQICRYMHTQTLRLMHVGADSTD